MVRAKVPEKVAMEIAGRKTRSIFDRYHIVSVEQMKDAFAQVARWKRAREARKGKVVKLR
jgi:hypothetical protein